MRLAKRFRPVKTTKLTKANDKKTAERIADNYSLIKALSETKTADRNPRAKKAAAKTEAAAE